MMPAPDSPVLPACPPPRQEESLNGYLLRLCEINGHATFSELHRIAGYKGLPLVFRWGTEGPIATLINQSVETVRLMSYQRGSTASERQHEVVLGHPIEPALVDPRKPKICTHCVAEQGFIQAFWDLTPVVACPRHAVMLLTHCPSCQRSLTWRRPGTLQCGCGAHWRNMNLEPVDGALLAFTRLAAAKASYKPPPRDNVLAVGFQRLSLGALLHVVTATGWWRQGCSHRSLAEFHGMSPAERIEIIKAGVDIFSDWPHMLFAAMNTCDLALSKFRSVLYDLPKTDVAFIRDAITAWQKGIAPRSRDRLKSRLGNDITAPKPAQFVGLTLAADRLGVSLKTMRSLVQHGLIHPATDRRNHQAFRITDLDALFRRFRQIAQPIPQASRSPQIRQMSEAFRLYCCREWTAKDVILGMEDGRIPVWYDGEAAPRLLNQFLFDLDDINKALKAWLEDTNPGWITVDSAAKRLGISNDAVLHSAGKGRLASRIVKVGSRNYRLVMVSR